MPFADPEKKREYYKAYAAKNRESLRRNHLKFREAHREKLRAVSAEYRISNQEACNQRTARWRAAHLDRHAESEARRRAQVRNTVVGDQTLVQEFYEKVRSARRIRCYWCREWAKKDSRHVDHIIPLSLGGAHSIGNLCCACASCNLSKSAKAPEQFCGQAEIHF